MRQVFFIILGTLLGTAAIVIAKKQGYAAGVDATLDTMNAIVSKQVRSDTSVTRLILIHPDTSVYILSRKTVLPR